MLPAVHHTLAPAGRDMCHVCAQAWGVLGSRTKNGGWLSLFQAAPTFESSSWEAYAHDQLLPPPQNSDTTPGQIVRGSLVAMFIAATVEGLARKSGRGRAIGVGTAVAGLVHIHASVCHCLLRSTSTCWPALL